MSFLMPKMPDMPKMPKMPDPQAPPQAPIQVSQTAAATRARAKALSGGSIGNKDIVLTSPFTRGLSVPSSRTTLSSGM